MTVERRIRCRHFWRYRNTLRFWFGANVVIRLTGERSLSVIDLERRLCHECATAVIG